MNTTTQAYARALRSVGVEAVVETVEVWKHRRIGGSLVPLWKAYTGRYPKDGDTRITTHWALNWTNTDIMTLGDFGAFLPPTWASSAQRWSVRRGLRTAKRLVFPSEQTLHEFHALFPGASIPAEVVPVPIPEFHADEGNRVIDVFWNGTLAPRKGLETFLRALLEEMVPRGLSVVVLLKPASPTYTPNQRQLIERVGKKHNLKILPGSIPLEELRATYATSKSYVSTSTYEGLHLPPLEAYFSGAVVVVPELPVYEENYRSVAGAILYKDARNPAGVAAAIVEAVHYGPFRIDEALRAKFSDQVSGRRLKEIVEAL